MLIWQFFQQQSSSDCTLYNAVHVVRMFRSISDPQAESVRTPAMLSLYQVPSRSALLTTTCSLPVPEMAQDEEVILTMHWNPVLIVISYLLAVQASYTTVSLLQLTNVRQQSWWWLSAVAALCFSVGGVWTMHLLGMKAMDLEIPVTYRMDLTVVSAFLAFLPTLAAFLILMNKIPKSADPDDLSAQVSLC